MIAESILALFFIAWVAGKWVGEWQYYRWEEKRRRESEKRWEEYKKTHPNDFGGSVIAFPLSYRPEDYTK